MVKRIIKSFILKFSERIVSLAEESRELKKIKKFGLDKTISVYQVDLSGKVEIGQFTYINPGSRISGGEHAFVKIGKYCAIGRYTRISAYTHSLMVPTPDENHLQNVNVEKEIIIGNYVWIGDGVFIKPGVVIGDYAIIGANSVVTKDVESFEVVGGVPARHLRYNESHYLFKKK